MDSPLLGAIFPFCATFAPVGWSQCAGQLVSIAENNALYAVLGTTYGGDGINTFGLPDLRGRVPVGQGQGPGTSYYNIGQIAGTESTTLTQLQMPSHNHSVNVYNAAGNTAVPTSTTVFAGSGGPNFFDVNTSTPNATLLPTSIGTAGSSIPINIIQPILVTTYIIAVQGLFPTRN